MEAKDYFASLAKLRHEDYQNLITHLKLSIQIATMLGEQHRPFIEETEREIEDLRAKYQRLGAWAKANYDIDMEELSA
jgi:hypothetical protein